ncbi:MAG: MotA/TolQ/ExbB proton channel family protein [Elusimicrobiota bacterium]
MDPSTLIGAVGCVTLIVLGAATGELSKVFLNWHGIIIVFGGTISALFINTPLIYIRELMSMSLSLWRRGSHEKVETLIPEITRIAEQVQTGGLGVLRNIDTKAAGGYLSSAATTALEYNNPEFVRTVLENEVNAQVDRANEVINVVRTAGVVAPMFGLIGTLVGIIKVLANIADPKTSMAYMAIAITSAFYGILLANVFCIPVAGKLRLRLWEELKIKAIVIEGVIGMMKGTVPLVLERKLHSFK